MLAQVVTVLRLENRKKGARVSFARFSIQRCASCGELIIKLHFDHGDLALQFSDAVELFRAVQQRSQRISEFVCVRSQFQVNRLIETFCAGIVEAMLTIKA